ncbi:MAG: mevalonate kinase [Anaerolineales bacterium]|jgi:mevalonate kinase
MPAISASAPGKIILFGEHAVVYGRPAIAVPVSQVQAKAVVVPNPGAPGGDIQVVAPDIDISGPLESLPLDNAITLAINLTLEKAGIPKPPAFKVKISSTIPIAAGMGSGAAVTVALIRAVSAFLGNPLPDNVVNEITFEIEKIYHGTPSGIDNTVVTYGMPVYFIKGEPIETFTVKKPFTILIGDTGVSSPTSFTVGQVRESWKAQPDVFDRLFDACGEIAAQARRMIETDDVAALGPLMDENQSLLVDMSVSSPELENLIATARDAGALGAKLSGAGGGGNMIALVSPDAAQDIAAALESAGAARTILTTVGKT